MKNSSRPQGFFTLGIAGLFLAGFFLLVTFGASTYRDAVDGQAENNRTRALLSYLRTCVKANDCAGAVRFYEDDGGPVLVIEDEGSGYALRIYQRDGKLVEDYAPVDSALQPQGAEVMGETEVFRIEQNEELIFVTTDEGKLAIRLRSWESGGGHEE